MCTAIASKAPITGSGKGADGWFRVEQAYVAYDHPFHAPDDHALSLDFVNESMGPGARVAVELSRDSARLLVERIIDALEQADEVDPDPLRSDVQRGIAAASQSG